MTRKHAILVDDSAGHHHPHTMLVPVELQLQLDLAPLLLLCGWFWPHLDVGHHSRATELELVRPSTLHLG